MDFSENRKEWTEKIIEALQARNYREVVRRMAENTRDRGDEYAMVEAFCQSATPTARGYQDC